MQQGAWRRGHERAREGRRRRQEQGTAAVEFALVVPLLVMLVSGIIVFGIVMAQQVALGNAARQAARSLVVPSATCGTTGASGAGLTRQAQTDATTIWLNPNAVTVDVDRAQTRPTDLAFGNDCTGSTVQPCSGSSVGDNVYVRLKYTSTFSMPFVQPSFNLSAIGAFRCEYA